MEPTPQEEDIYIAAGFCSVNVRDFTGRRHRIRFRIIKKEIYVHRNFLWMVVPGHRPTGLRGYFGHKQMVEQVNRINEKHFYTYEKYINFRRLAWHYWNYVKHRVVLLLYKNRHITRPRVRKVWKMCEKMVIHFHKCAMSELYFDKFLNNKTIEYFCNNPQRLRKLYQIFVRKIEACRSSLLVREYLYFYYDKINQNE